MKMKYEVIRPWHGVKQGQIVELKDVHPSLKPRVRKLPADAQLEVATPEAAKPAQKK